MLGITTFIWSSVRKASMLAREKAGGCEDRDNRARELERLAAREEAAKTAVGSFHDTERNVRFDFTRDATDISASMLALRTELHMKVVMPSIVGHSEDAPYMAVGRYENSPD